MFSDANLLVLASLHGARASAIVDLADAGRVALRTSAQSQEEARRNLRRKTAGALPKLERRIAKIELVAEAPSALVIWAVGLGLDRNDAPILAAAAHARADGLVTGDRRHFGPLFGQSLRGVAVLSLAEALERVLRAAEGG